MRTTHTAFAAILITATVLTACGGQETGGTDAPSIPAQQWTPGTPPPTGSDPTRTPAPAATTLPDIAAGVDRQDPDSMATAALTVWFTWNTAVDAGPNDAAARTAPLLTADYAREITSTTAQSSPGAQWLDWAARGAVLTPDLVADDEPVPPQNDSTAYRSYRVTQRIDGAPVSERVVAMILRRGSDGWEVSRIQDK
ncbi:hypothetical protein CH306_17645 [Rhodococcus sp. 15-725-2-2b]|uniref:hypothetical protein n=1 Tax=unclassified Rhodococcus (in: high G+C Gram-positive bacteria) TaxID=192944 RepID=UPI000B9BB2BE|nr:MULTISPECIES: hypothetical protein [unclassified Rhodococcus (in: high G+C Gram-positive bacteria)]OZC61994.1 hypothetical protein CH276_15410 [Rhodococcus sp. 06-470-2]OZC64508.1 hypothetical protein CH277_17550 [Rhodococcus sp. 06-469-3-2]OZD51141.1 hypothetical protein CH264_02185 [Rhodococcus sp. 06-1477-1A]OZE58124.1 hypothetical protein CH265_23000 [Rhodococcus sp. 05-2221-1B]OZE71580.1 hypothetical protein CH306_17645 [Rhodococcus sp. 15-725-2-2b]